MKELSLGYDELKYDDLKHEAVNEDIEHIREVFKKLHIYGKVFNWGGLVYLKLMMIFKWKERGRVNE